MAGDAQTVEALNTVLNATNRCKCIFSHNFLTLNRDETNAHLNGHLRDLIALYKEKYQNETTVMSPLNCMCHPCLFVIFGLWSSSFGRKINDRSCYPQPPSENREGPPDALRRHSLVNMGTFLQAQLCYDIRPTEHNYMAYATKIAIQPGIIVLPDWRILVQTLALRPAAIVTGVKVIMKVGSEDDGSVDKCKDMEEGLLGVQTYLDKFKDNLLHNGYYRYVKANVATSTKAHFERFTPKDGSTGDIHLKVFDLNPNMTHHYNQLLQSQRFMANRDSLGNETMVNKILNAGGGGYIRRDSSRYRNLGESRVYDILSYALAFTDKNDTMKKYPPFNGDCIATVSNVLVVDQDGLALFRINEQPDASCRANLKRALASRDDKKKMIRPTVPVAAASVSNLMRIPPSPYLDPSGLPITAGNDPVKSAAEDILAKHALELTTYRQLLQGKAADMKQYFASFKDDEGNDINKDQTDVLVMAQTMYPQKVVNFNSVSTVPQSVDFGESTDEEEYMADYQSSCNMVYVKNIGFVSLHAICQKMHLTLKNTEVLLHNLIRRSSGVHSYLTKDVAKSMGIHANVTTVTIGGEQIVLNRPEEDTMVGDLYRGNTPAIVPQNNNFTEPEPDLESCLVPTFKTFAQKYTSPPKCKGLM